MDKGSKSYLYSIVLVAVLGGLLFGYDTAVISGVEKGLQAFFLGAADFQYTDFMHGFTSSSALIGCIIGALLSGMMATIAALREKYDLHMTVERYTPSGQSGTDERFIRK